MVVKASINELNKASAEGVASRGDIVFEALTKHADIFDKPIPDLVTLKTKNDLLKGAILDMKRSGAVKSPLRLSSRNARTWSACSASKQAM